MMICMGGYGMRWEEARNMSNGFGRVRKMVSKKNGYGLWA